MGYERRYQRRPPAWRDDGADTRRDGDRKARSGGPGRGRGFQIDLVAVEPRRGVLSRDRCFQLPFTSTDEAIGARNRVTRAAMDRCVLLNPSAGAGSAADPLTGRSLSAAPEVFT